MRYSKLSAAILALAILIQLAVPAVFIAEKTAILREGTEYRLLVNWIDFDEDKITLQYDILNNWNDEEMRYAVLTNEVDGVFHQILLSKDPPEEGVYMRSASVRKFICPIEEYAIPGLDNDACFAKWNELTNSGHYAVAVFRSHQEKALLTGVCLEDGTPLEDALQQP